MSRLVVADTSPINYLVLIGHIDILPALFERVILPAAVWRELNHTKAPAAVKEWVASRPAWVDVRQANHLPNESPEVLDAGEEEAIALALELNADLLLLDDEEGVMAARANGLQVTGTLGVLSRAAQRHLIDLRDALTRLKQTNFRCRQEMMDRFIAEQRGIELSACARTVRRPLSAAEGEPEGYS